ncbi:MAG TPA: multidrug transporter [Rhodobacteraceae bacterium]|jgi:putative MATE family efflux protein|nr:multidrug transporter [Paracoccaceae bacterium]
MSQPPSAAGKFTTGSTMRHVVIMTLTGSLGLSFMFLVDFLALWWISQLGEEVLISAVGFAGTIQFFVISISIGMMIGAVAMVSRALGQRDQERARAIGTSSIIYAVSGQLIIATLAWVFRREILVMTGAEGQALEEAIKFLTISLPSLPLIAAGMNASAILRAEGDAWRSMLVTTSGGLVAIVIDPLFIIWMGWGVEGAGAAIVVSRLAMAILGLYWVAVSRKLLAKPSWNDLRRFLRPFLMIAVPAIATQVSTPFGNWVLVRAMASYGDSAVAGLGVVGRLQILCFGGIFALSGAIGGIIGQNHGAGLTDRVKSAYVDALKFCVLYTGVMWVVMVLASDWVSQSFNLAPEGQAVVETFTHWAAGSFVFTGALFVSNAAFNNLGRPLWATAANWFRDGLLMAPTALVMGAAFGAAGVIWAQALANVMAGGLAGWMGWRLVSQKKKNVLASKEAVGP